jgi:hypothetical protein
MFAHVVTFQGPVEQLETAGMQGFHERVVPVLHAQAGFQSCLTLLDRTHGTLLGITLWDTEEHASEAATRLERERRTGVSEMSGTTSPTAALYEVLAQL